jgi:hypothetical protein
MGRLAMRVLLLLLPFSQAEMPEAAEAPPTPLEEYVAGSQLPGPPSEPSIVIDCQLAAPNDMGLVADCAVRPVAR